jgi:hypothetical protein
MTNDQTYPADEAILNGTGIMPSDARVAPRDGNAPAAPKDMREALLAANLGPNLERLEEVRPELVNALRELVLQYRQEGIVARRHEIRRIRQARLFWQGLQYAWWNPQDMTWHLPFETKTYDDNALEEMPRYQFVTNLYQAFGLSFISVLSQDVPATRFYPQSALSSAFNALAQNAANRAARTRNSAGYGELIDDLARQQGQQQANLAQQNQIAFGNAARSDTLSALSGLSGLYGTDTSLLGRALGIPSQLLSARASASQGGGFRFGLGPTGLSFNFNG